METFKDTEVVFFSNAAAFDSWLETNFRRQHGIWVRMAKKGSGIPSITSDEAVDVGLCWGWISGQRMSHDRSYYLQKYLPRRNKSVWSQVNVAKVEELIASGRMRSPGLAEVEAAKADGRWAAAYVSQRNASPPEDLLEALGRNQAASEFFRTLNRTDQYGVILKLMKIQNPERRAARLEKIVSSLAAREKAM